MLQGGCNGADALGFHLTWDRLLQILENKLRYGNSVILLVSWLNFVFNDPIDMIFQSYGGHSCNKMKRENVSRRDIDTRHKARGMRSLQKDLGIL